MIRKITRILKLWSKILVKTTIGLCLFLFGTTPFLTGTILLCHGYLNLITLFLLGIGLILILAGSFLLANAYSDFKFRMDELKTHKGTYEETGKETDEEFCKRKSNEWVEYEMVK